MPDNSHNSDEFKLSPSQLPGLIFLPVGKIFSDIYHTNVFLGQSPKAIEINMKINKEESEKLA